MNKFLKIEIEVRAGVEKFYEDIFVAENLETIQGHINELLQLSYRYASKKNNRPNKGLKVFQEYFKIQESRESKIKKQIKKREELNYKDFIEQFLILRKRGYSYRKIAKYAQAELQLKVSSETIRKSIKDLEIGNV